MSWPRRNMNVGNGFPGLRFGKRAAISVSRDLTGSVKPSAIDQARSSAVLDPEVAINACFAVPDGAAFPLRHLRR